MLPIAITDYRSIEELEMIDEWMSQMNNESKIEVSNE